ncbi:MAG TPA: hypothetical protein VFE19_03120 [Jatrophihabitantaceae bacterium]|nr:hypothetical protein [Jatrophihabitantaceae bacterium]
MTSLRNDQDLERLLRATLDGRADLVQDGPRWETTAVPSHRRRWLAPAVAAAVVAALAGALVALQQANDDQSRPTRSPSPTVRSAPDPSPTATSLPPTAHPARRAALTTFGLRPLPGYATHAAWSEPGYRQRAVRIIADPDEPIGCNGCESASDYITVYAKGRFDAAANGVTSWPTTSVANHPTHLGQLAWVGGPSTRLPTMAWEYEPDSWALVQGVTPLGGRTATLQQVAAAVEPSAAEPILVPFRLTWAPDLAVTDVFDDRSENYALVFDLGSGGGHGFSAAVQRGQTPTVPMTAKYRTAIGGLTGYYNRRDAVADVHLGKVLVEFGLTDGVDGQQLDEADRRDMDHIVAGLRWSNGTGQAPYFALDRAIP